MVAIRTRWKMGNVRRISVYHSCWLPVPKGFKECSPRLFADDLRVKHLILAIGQWNFALIKKYFFRFEVDMILSRLQPLSEDYSYC